MQFLQDNKFERHIAFQHSMLDCTAMQTLALSFFWNPNWPVLKGKITFQCFSCYMVNENCHMHNNNPFANLWQRRGLVLDADHDHGSGADID